MASHGICDDADAAAGMSAHTHPLTPTHELKTKKPRLESFPKSLERVNTLVKSFETMETIDGRPIRSPFPSLHKRKPKNLQPMPAESRDVPATMLSRNPNLPARLPKRNGSCASMQISPKKTKTPAYTSPKTKKSPTGRTKMAIKAMQSPLFDTSAHSLAKEIILGSSSDWMGSPKKVVRETSYNIETCSDSQEVSIKSSRGISPSNKSPRRHSKESRNMAKTTKALMQSHKSCRELIGSNETQPELRRSAGKNETKAVRSRSTGRNETMPRRRRSKEKSETKSERRRSTG